MFSKNDSRKSDSHPPTYGGDVALAELGTTNLRSPRRSSSVEPLNVPTLAAPPEQQAKELPRPPARRRISRLWVFVVAVVVLIVLSLGIVGTYNTIACNVLDPNTAEPVIFELSNTQYSSAYVNMLTSIRRSSSSFTIKRSSAATTGKITVRAAIMGISQKPTADTGTPGELGVRWEPTASSHGELSDSDNTGNSALAWFRAFLQLPGQCAKIHVDAELPPMQSVRMYAANGDITVSDTTNGLADVEIGEVIFTTTNGAILVGGLKSAKFSAVSTNGRVEVFSASVAGAPSGSYVTASSSNGEVVVRNVTGFEAITATSSNGPVSGTAVSCDRLALVSTNGKVTSDAVSVRYEFSAISSNAGVDVGNTVPLAFLPRPSTSNGKLKVDIQSTNGNARVQASSQYQGLFEVYARTTSVTSTLSDVNIKKETTAGKTGSKGSNADTANATFGVTTTNGDASLEFK